MIVLVDTSVWIRFLAGREPFASALDALLDREEVLAHKLVFGELLIGARRSRSALLASYDALAAGPVHSSPGSRRIRTRPETARAWDWMDRRPPARLGRSRRGTRMDGRR